MASQAGIIDEINARTSHAAAEAFARGAGMSRGELIFLLTALSAMAFFRTFISAGGPFGGRGAIRAGVNAWAGEFITAAKLYELRHADKEKALRESRDFA